MIWDVDVGGVVWEDGCAKPASSNVGDFAPLSFKELAAKKALIGGPITAAARSMPAANFLTKGLSSMETGKSC